MVTHTIEFATRKDDIQEIDSTVKNKWRWEWQEDILIKQFIRKTKVPGQAFCTLCDRTLIYHSGGRKDLQRHVNISPHGQAMKSVKKNSKVKVQMGVPDSDSAGPVRKRQRLSLKSARSKTKSSPASDNTSNNATKQSPPKSEVGQSGTSPQAVAESVATTESKESCDSTELEDESSTSASKSEARVPPVSSLENLGNTCFMNSVMQVLRYTPGFLDNLAFLFEDIMASEKIKRKSKLAEEENNLEVDEEVSQKSWKVVKNLYRVFRDLSLLEEKYEEVASDDVMSMAVKPIRLLNSIREINAMFEGNMQHDAQEFLRCLLSYLQDAEKEGRKFYSQLPQRFSPKASIHPIMQKFLQAAQQFATVKAEVKAEPEKPDSVEKPECEKVKVNLLSKLAPVSKIAKSVEDIAAGPKIGDTAAEAEKNLKKESESAMEMEPDAAKVCTDKIDIRKGLSKAKDINRNNPGKSEDMENSPCKPKVIRNSPSKVKEIRNSPVKSNSTSIKEKTGKCAKKRRNNSDKELASEKNQPVVVLQRNVFSKRRLGMRGAVVVKSADDIHSVNTKPDMPQKSKSLSPKKECENEDLTDKDFVQGIKQELADSRDPPVVRSQSDSAVDRMSFQDMFSHFITAKPDDDSDSVDLVSDSDSEDIVAMKKKAKELHESPRRSPRKTASLNSPAKPYRPSPLTSARSESAVDNLRTNLCSAMNGEKEPALKVGQSSPNSVNFLNSAECTPEMPDSVFMATTKMSPDNSSLRCNSPWSSGSTSSSPATNVAMEPVVKLENCDFVFAKNETSVSALYASKHLSPNKRSPRKFSRNYLKQRNCLASFNGYDEEMLQAALHEMLNSPVKSRSKYDLIERLFQGTVMLRTRCLHCESSRERTEDFHDVSVPVRLEKQESDEEDEESEEDGQGGCSLLDLIEASTEVERLIEDNKYFCDKCKCYAEAEISTHYDVMPDILTLHLKRFSAESGKLGYITKINDHVNIPITLPCLRYKCPKKCLRPDHKYELYSIITHSGGSLSSGHYLAYVRALPKKSDLLNTQLPAESKLCAEDIPAQNCDTVLPEEVKAAKTKEKVTVTRRKAGVAPKLPSRFNNSIMTNTKVKTFANLVEKKSKPSITETLKTSVRFTSEWFECDDETVRVFNESDFVDLLSGRDGSLLGTPYLLFYHKATLA